MKAPSARPRLLPLFWAARAPSSDTAGPGEDRRPHPDRRPQRRRFRAGAPADSVIVEEPAGEHPRRRKCRRRAPAETTPEPPADGEQSTTEPRRRRPPPRATKCVVDGISNTDRTAKEQKKIMENKLPSIWPTRFQCCTMMTGMREEIMII